MGADRRVRWIRLTPKAHVPFDPEVETGVLVWVPRRKVS